MNDAIPPGTQVIVRYDLFGAAGSAGSPGVVTGCIADSRTGVLYMVRLACGTNTAVLSSDLVPFTGAEQ